MACNLAGSLKLNDHLNEWQMEFAPPWWKENIWREETVFDNYDQNIWFNIDLEDRIQIESRMKIAWILEEGFYYRSWAKWEDNITNGQDCYEYLSNAINQQEYLNSLGFKNPNIKNKIRDFKRKESFDKNLILAVALGLAVS